MFALSTKENLAFAGMYVEWDVKFTETGNRKYVMPKTLQLKASVRQRVFVRDRIKV